MKFYEQFNKYMEEANVERLAQQDPREVYGEEPEKVEDGSSVDTWHKAQLEKEAGPDKAFKALENVLGQFYALGQKGLVADGDVVMERVAEILRQHDVDDRDIGRFTNVLGSIILGQSTRGFADSRYNKGSV